VDLVDKHGGPSRTLCFMPEGHLAVGDVMLAQKFALELFESEALLVANRTPVWESISKTVRRDYRL
jgi:MOSC domain-containing protein YiiM